MSVALGTAVKGALAVKAGADVVSNLDQGPEAALLYALSALLSGATNVPMGAETGASLMKQLPDSVADYMDKNGQVILPSSIEAEKSTGPVEKDSLGLHHEGKNIISLTTVDAAYQGNFGNLKAVFSNLSEGRIPSGHEIHLALLDIIDYIDMGLLGDSITQERLQEHLHTHEVTIKGRVDAKETVTPYTSQSGEKVDADKSKTVKHEAVLQQDVKIQTDGLMPENIDSKQIRIVKDETIAVVEKEEAEKVTENGFCTETAKAVSEELHKEKTGIYIQENGGPEALLDAQNSEARLTNTSIITTISASPTWWERICGSKIERTQTVTGSVEKEWRVERLNPETGEMVLVDSSKDVQEIDPTKQIFEDWDSGYVSFVPILGTGADLWGKHVAGFELSAFDYGTIVMDVATTALTFGVGSVIGKAAVVGGGKVVAQGVAKQVSKKMINKSATKAVASEFPVAKLSGVKAVEQLSERYLHPGQVFSNERILAKTATAYKNHNPMRGDFLKTHFGLHELESRGVKIGDFLKAEFADRGAEGKLIAKQLEGQYRFLKFKGMLTPENLERLSVGKNPIGLDGMKYDIDHVIAMSKEPLLKAHPANLQFLKHDANLAKSNRVMYRSMDRIRHFADAMPDWKPSEALVQDIKKFMQEHPDYLQKYPKFPGVE